MGASGRRRNEPLRANRDAASAAPPIHDPAAARFADAVRALLLSTSEQYALGAQRDSDPERSLYNNGVSKAYAAAAEAPQIAHVYIAYRMNLIGTAFLPLHEVAEELHDFAVQEEDWRKKVTMFGVCGGYTNIQDDMNSDDPIMALTSRLEGIRRTLSGSGVKGRWLRG